MPTSPAAAIHYHPDGFDTGGPRLMGRQAAGEGFLRGWLRWSGADPLTLWTASDGHFAHGRKLAADMGWTGAVRRAGPDQPEALISEGALFLPGPGLADSAWLRRWRADRAWSLIGITHTTASHRALDAITGVLAAPVQPWDALICTSKAVLDTVEQVLDGEQAWLAARLGATRFVRPQTPVIPLGIHTDDFTRDEALRGQWRGKLGIAPDAVCVLWMGRLSFHAKAHPAPLCVALERAAQASGAKVALLLAGWFANEGQEKVFRQNAAELAPSVSLHAVDARAREARKGVWSAADVFTLPSDNIQETFGLAPVEGMAAGLPVVATDWDGFRDTVADGVHGFLAPTFQPAAGQGRSIAFAHEHETLDYDHYVGAAAQHAGFDIDALAAAFTRLFKEPDLRARMGAAGQAHARANLDWRIIIARYLDLTRELAAIRANPGTSAQTGNGPRPAREDPFTLFEGYPTFAIEASTIVEADPLGRDAEALWAAEGHLVSARSLPPLADIARLLARVRETGKGPASRLWEGAEPPRRALIARTLAWLGKHGAVRLRQPEPGDTAP